MAPTVDLAHNPGMFPDWELNQRPFGSEASTQSTETHQPGWFLVLRTFRWLIWSLEQLCEVGMIYESYHCTDDPSEGQRGFAFVLFCFVLTPRCYTDGKYHFWDLNLGTWLQSPLVCVCVCVCVLLQCLLFLTIPRIRNPYSRNTAFGCAGHPWPTNPLVAEVSAMLCFSSCMRLHVPGGRSALVWFLHRPTWARGASGLCLMASLSFPSYAFSGLWPSPEGAAGESDQVSGK